MGIIEGLLIDIDESQILKQLGYRDNVPPKDILECIEKEILKTKEYIIPRLIWEKINIQSIEKDRVFLKSNGVLEGEYIARKLKDCQYVLFTLATLGHEIDSIIKQSFDAGDYLKGMIVDAIGSDAIEHLNKKFWDGLIKDIGDAELGITSRLSPGTGEWNIKDQGTLFQYIDSQSIGVTLMESYMMVPLKSTSVIYGVGHGIGIRKTEHICSECNMKECAYKYGQ